MLMELFFSIGCNLITEEPPANEFSFLYYICHILYGQNCRNQSN